MNLDKCEEIKLCPNCNKPMILKKGKYGLFWGCSKYPKCKCSIDARGKRIKQPRLEIIDVDYMNLINNDDIKKLIYECGKSNEKVNSMLQNYNDIKQCIEDNNLCYKVLEYLHKHQRYLDISKVIYTIYLVRGELPKNFRFWINNFNYRTEYIEKDIKRLIIDSWKSNIFGNMKLDLIGEEVFIGDFDEGGGIVDILAKNDEDNTDILIEIKGPKIKGKAAWGQLIAYLKIYEKFQNKKAKGVIVSRGYPWGIYENIFLLVGYVIECNKIAFIPWRV